MLLSAVMMLLCDKCNTARQRSSMTTPVHTMQHTEQSMSSDSCNETALLSMLHCMHLGCHTASLPYSLACMKLNSTQCVKHACSAGPNSQVVSCAACTALHVKHIVIWKITCTKLALPRLPGMGLFKLKQMSTMLMRRCYNTATLVAQVLTIKQFALLHVHSYPYLIQLDALIEALARQHNEPSQQQVLATAHSVDTKPHWAKLRQYHTHLQGNDDHIHEYIPFVKFMEVQHSSGSDATAIDAVEQERA